MELVEVTFDCIYQTWNVMLDEMCIFYGDAFAVDDFLNENSDKYQEDA